MKLIRSLLTALALFSPSLFAETQYANVQLQAGVDILYYSAYSEVSETYPIELHWINPSNQLFQLELSCNGKVMQRIWSRDDQNFIRITIGSDMVTSCPTAIRAQVSQNSVADLYLQVLDYVRAQRPGTSSPPLGVSCMGDKRLLREGQSETLQAVPYGNMVATCINGITPPTLSCNTDAVAETANSCRPGRSCGGLGHNRSTRKVGPCHPVGELTETRYFCYDGNLTTTTAVLTCRPEGPIL